MSQTLRNMIHESIVARLSEASGSRSDDVVRKREVFFNISGNMRKTYERNVIWGKSTPHPFLTELGELVKEFAKKNKIPMERFMVGTTSCILTIKGTAADEERAKSLLPELKASIRKNSKSLMSAAQTTVYESTKGLTESNSHEDLVTDILSYLPDRLQPEVDELDDDMMPIYDDSDLKISVSKNFVSAEINPAKGKSYSLEFSVKGGKVTDVSVVSDSGDGSQDDLLGKKYSVRDAKKIAKDIQQYL
tara:strand:+ start:334 stop:1077 length:744 start_codon:yes stop_codon:yes gene_type:complete